MGQTEEWFSKADLDFFGPFSALFFSCNARYKEFYSEVVRNKDYDGEYIDFIKEDFSENSLGLCFKNRFYSISNNVSSLYFALKEAQINHRGRRVELNNIKLYERSIDIIPVEEQTPEIILSYALGLDTIPEKYADPHIDDSIKIGDLYIKNDLEFIFGEIFDVIYKMRCSFFHGELIPNHETNNIIKYCYFILYEIMFGVLTERGSISND